MLSNSHYFSNIPYENLLFKIQTNNIFFSKSFPKNSHTKIKMMQRVLGHPYPEVITTRIVFVLYRKINVVKPKYRVPPHRLFLHKYH